MSMTHRVVKPLIIALIAILLILVPGLRLPYLDRHTDSYFTSSITRAGVAYGVCRGVNAAVSVIKESEVQLEPGGLGVSLAPGQVLDPLDDLAERASDILITAIVSLGIQKITYDLCVAVTPRLIGVALLILLALSRVKHERARLFQSVLRRALVIVVMGRFCLPVSSLANTYLQDSYFTPQITQARTGLSLGSPELDKLKEINIPEADGVMGTVRNGLGFVAGKSVDYAAALKAMARNMSRLIDNLLKLAYLYAAVFLVQVILLPLLAFWILVKTANALFGLTLQPVLKHAPAPPASLRPP